MVLQRGVRDCSDWKFLQIGGGGRTPCWGLEKREPGGARSFGVCGGVRGGMPIPDSSWAMEGHKKWHQLLVKTKGEGLRRALGHENASATWPDAKKWVPRPGEAVVGTPAAWTPAWALLSSVSSCRSAPDLPAMSELRGKGKLRAKKN